MFQISVYSPEANNKEKTLENKQFQSKSDSVILNYSILNEGININKNCKSISKLL